MIISSVVLIRGRWRNVEGACHGWSSYEYTLDRDSGRREGGQVVEQASPGEENLTGRDQEGRRR